MFVTTRNGNDTFKMWGLALVLPGGIVNVTGLNSAGMAAHLHYVVVHDNAPKRCYVGGCPYL